MPVAPSPSASSLPRSVAGWLDPLLIAVALMSTYLALRDTPLGNPALAMVLVAVNSLVVCLIELWRAEWRKQPRPDRSAAQVWQGALATFAGTVGGIALVLVCWWALAEYRQAYYKPLFVALPTVLRVGIPLTAACILVSEWRIGPDDSGTRQIGDFLLGRGAPLDGTWIRCALLDLAIKGFFLPINFCELSHGLGRLRGPDHHLFELPWPQAHALVLQMIYVLIIGAILPGYLFGSRLFGNQTRKVDDTWFGWGVTLCCYAPFVGPVFGDWFNYHPAKLNPSWMKPWIRIFSDAPVTLAVIGCAIIVMALWHCWSEAHFGLRSSNLSHRGIVTNGPYRFCKHPVYLSKCIGWALIWTPFLAGSTRLECLRLTILFACVCAIYAGRAWVEERLLSTDPDYVAYALWMDEHGMFSRFGKQFPPLTFAWRQARWHR